MSLGQSLVMTFALIVFFAAAVIGAVAYVMTRSPRRQEPQSLLAPRPQPALRALREQPSPEHLHAAGPSTSSSRRAVGRERGRAAA
jgi:uncharacterized membrane protein